MKDFYTHWFGACAGPLYHNFKTGLKTYFLTFDGGCRLELMTRPDIFSREKPALADGYTHISFQLGTQGAVDALTASMQAGGCTVLSGPRTTGDGYYESCVLDPEGNQIEIMA